jgi:Domain of unknown function (DUF1707)
MERFSEEPDRQRVRASDAERDDALRSLAAHYADGRLDQPEFDRRSDAALAAVTRDQLRTLFTDLPGRQAAVPERAVRMRGGPPRPAVPVLVAVLFALAVVAVLHGAPPFPLIPLIFILSRRRRRWNREVRPWT